MPLPEWALKTQCREGSGPVAGPAGSSRAVQDKRELGSDVDEGGQERIQQAAGRKRVRQSKDREDTQGRCRAALSGLVGTDGLRCARRLPAGCDEQPGRERECDAEGA